MQAAVPAGLRHFVTKEGLAELRLQLACIGAAAFAALGVLFSTPLGAIGLAGGAIWGWTSVGRALRAEKEARRRALEQHLSQAIEVICLGLRSGLSFDKALSMYCSCFDTVFARQLSVAQGEWNAGLRTREEALRDVQESYDSRLLERAVDGIVRSMRFGSPLADALDALAVEARNGHKAEVEEAVMKAPVKMMVPVGTLILPSMLLLVMGPVVLDLLS